MAANDSSKKRQQKVGIPDNRRGQQMGVAGQPVQNREREVDAPARRGQLKDSNKMFADKSAHSTSAGATRSNSPSTSGMTSGGHPGESTGEMVFKRRLKRSGKK